ncbi:L-threonylcarbamoyladenylate synthase [Thermocoleostomius sinensis]|jgi:L-threonylcarbamoyladenylate synthase|uniref:L-threonylcarbamoyladenylate synthase n=1 Tax=Thermocoleostomius sinensis A174 TaxID=2016057 RepID=A0A9E8ZGF7_9CYAN|nr:L-threonylcarbamoyladenylate synthase [Thermocoleostomius sinensis]WAL62632.1 L-threonylcarbamoyladenylate synthase [Thermocoleostomius sinensis A174]
MPGVSFSELVSAARSGDRLVSFPTDTVPALAVRPDRSALIFEAKQRSHTKPLILMAATADDLWPYVQGSDAEFNLWQQVAATYWPGALTLVLPASDRLPPEMNPTDPTTIGIRVPNHAIARHILAQTRPLATTSVNRSGQPPLETLTDINAEFPEVLTLRSDELAELERTLMLETQPSSRLPSTVAKWTSTGWEILRQGTVRLEG